MIFNHVPTKYTITMRSSFSPAFPTLLVVWALGCTASLAVADNLSDAQHLLKQGQPVPALEKVEAHLAGKPADAQGRFTKGLILTEMGRWADAMTVFSKLIEDYPELPEPYNNLAVLYAEQKQYDKARTALEMAIRIQPDYATAYENLGDIHARLAIQAYDKALQLDPGKKPAQLKLSKLRDLAGSALGKAATTASGLTVREGGAAVSPLAASQEKPSVAPAGDEAEIGRLVQGWARAWSRKDAKAYFAYYAADFRTPRGMTRNAWEEARTRPMRKPGKLLVEVEDIRVSLADGQATVRFRQRFSSPALTSTVGKVMVLVKSGGRWLIQQERVA